MSLQSLQRQTFILQGQVANLQNQNNSIQADVVDLQNDVAGLPALTTQVGTNTTDITTLQGLILPIWKSGGEHDNPNVLLPASTNTLIRTETITTTTTTAKYLILASFEGTSSVNGTIYMTIGRSTNASPTATTTINLANRVSALTNSINGNGLSMWRSQYNTANLSAYASVVDTPNFIGNVQYSLWALDTAPITNTGSELANLTILQVLP